MVTFISHCDRDDPSKGSEGNEDMHLWFLGSPLTRSSRRWERWLDKFVGQVIVEEVNRYEGITIYVNTRCKTCISFPLYLTAEVELSLHDVGLRMRTVTWRGNQEVDVDAVQTTSLPRLSWDLIGQHLSISILRSLCGYVAGSA